MDERLESVVAVNVASNSRVFLPAALALVRRGHGHSAPMSWTRMAGLASCLAKRLASCRVSAKRLWHSMFTCVRSPQLALPFLFGVARLPCEALSDEMQPGNPEQADGFAHVASPPQARAPSR